MLNDAHCHFFSPQFFATLSKLRGKNDSVEGLCQELRWDDPKRSDDLADRWIRELDVNGVQRATLIASVSGDEESVATAVARHPSRVVGFFMVDPTSPHPEARTRRALEDLSLRAVCLFPAMHHVALDDERVRNIVEVAASHAGTAVFVHCGVLSMGVRRKLGLPSRFDLRLGDPLGVAHLAAMFPKVPFIIPHFGAGMLREALMAADVCPNIYLDTSSSNSWIRYMSLTLDEIYKMALSVVGPERLLFGTDSSFFPRGWQRPVYDAQLGVMKKLGVGDAHQEMIFGGNFDRLFPRS